MRENKFPSRGRRRKRDPFAGPNAPVIDYKNVEVLQRFITERGKIVPRRQSGVSAKNQRSLTRAIKQARNCGLLPVLVR